ncbi:Phosphotransferase enzyme family protein [Corynebacterium capitovis DSM 44611]|uniref:phosphotransferase n=1 Tax=Corynebacterium capitovis TaxID=131081 RepID=UPI000374709B|nr:phosphotransferase [Corynebacterium capitovis]WKD57573.1 Phosphotransferase enzyme family protein [Corynebacterium capitovis DSM 44611]
MDQHEVIAAAEEVLTHRYGGSQKLVDATRLYGSGSAGVFRARVATSPFLQHRSVVVKQSPETGDALEDGAFIREVVAYQFTTSLSEDVRPGPVLLGYDLSRRLIIISDSGDGDTLETLLNSADEDNRVQVLRNLGTALGRMHAGTAGKEVSYDTLLARMVKGDPDGKRVQQQRDKLLVDRMETGARALEAAGITLPTEVSIAAANTQTRLLKGGSRAFTSFDLAPDNIIYADRTQFLDYEWAGFRDVTFDVAFVIAGFPNHVLSYPISDNEAGAFIDAWVREVEKLWPAVRHEDTLQARMTAALLCWALSSVGMSHEADLFRLRSKGPFDDDERMLRRDLYETFDALARYSGTGRDTAYLVIADWARGVAARLA